MADRALELTVADQAYANQAMVLLVMSPSNPHWRVAAAAARDLRPAVNDEHLWIGPMVRALEARLDLARQPNRGGMELFRVEQALRSAVQNFVQWRGALAYDAWRASAGVPA